ncbi:MAG: MASE1 domain-containing protein, partial [Gaiellales bacterium]
MTDDTTDHAGESHAGTRSTPRAVAYAIESILIVIGYLLLGDLNRHFTPPPMGIAPIWLPAGFALGVVLTRGWWTTIPLFVTGIIATFRADLSLTKPVLDGGAGLEMTTLLWAAVLFGLAIVSHAVVARVLIERFLGPSQLDGVRSAVVFLLFAGPVSCAFSALLGTEVYRVEGFLAPDAFIANMFTFWIGDSIACMLIAPIFVAAFGGPRWRDRRLAITTLAVTTALLILSTAMVIGNAENKRARDTFKRSMSSGIRDFKASVRRVESATFDFAAFAAASHPVTSAAFEEITSDRLERVPSAELFAFIETPDGNIDGARVVHAVGDGAVAFKAAWVASPITTQLEDASRHGRMAWVPEADDPGAVHDFLYAPVFGPAIASSPREQLIGFVGTRLDLQEALRRVVAGSVDAGAAAIVIDERSDAPNVLLGATHPTGQNVLLDGRAAPLSVARADGAAFTTRHEFAVGDTRWVATFAPSSEFLIAQSFLPATLPSSLLSMLLALTIGVLGLSSTGSQVRLARLVRTRTREVRASEHRYRSVVDNVREAIFQIDAGDQITFASSAWNEMLTSGGSLAALGNNITEALKVKDADRLSEMAADARSAPGFPIRGEFESSEHEL